jgi:hypothetical protein
MGFVTAALTLTGSGLQTPVAAQVAAGSAPTIEVPLTFVDGRPTVPVVAADGIELRFAVSTGNGTTVLTESLATRREAIAKLTLGGLVVPLEGMATVPDAGLHGDSGAIDGIIGANMLRDYDVLLDAPGGRLVLRTVGRSVSWPGVALSEPIPLRIFHGLVISLDVTLDGIEYPATLDTGTPFVLLNPAAGGQLGIGGAGRVTVSLGEATIPDVPVRVEDHHILRRWAPDGSAFVLLGGAIARDCAVSISWVHREMRVCAR